MPDQPKKFYLTTPIYYVNAHPHIGHAYTTIVADVLARRRRLLGDDTFFLTGTDEHGQKIERSAAAAGIAPQQFADEVSAEFRKLWDRMGLTYDRFIRTTSEEHKRGAQKLFAELYERGFIYLDSYTGQYSIGEEMFVEGPPGTIGPDGKPTETVTEENFFFKLSSFQRDLIDLIESDKLLITPEASKNEVLSFLRGNVSDAAGLKLAVASKSAAEQSEHLREANQPGSRLSYSSMGSPYIPGALKDLSVSRSSFTWGIPVPENVQAEAGVSQKHVIYVWLDALANYVTAIGYGSDSAEEKAAFKRLWPADLQLVGKEITRFHCVYWPAFLMAAGLRPPKQITANGWLLFDNAKMSKSRGNVVRTETILEAFGEHVYGKQFPESTERERDLFAADVLRYFLLREIPFGQDGSFSFDAMVTRYNADLANGYGNLVSRVLNLIGMKIGASIPPENVEQFIRLLRNEDTTPSVSWKLGKFKGLGISEQQWSAGPTLDCRVYELEADNRQNTALETLGEAVSATDGFLTVNAPWKLNSEEPGEFEELERVLYTAAESIRIITALLFPYLPFSTARVWAQLGLGNIEEAACNGGLKNLRWGGLKPGTKLGLLAPIFPRADKGLAQIMIDMENERNASTGAATTSQPMASSRSERPTASLKSAATPAAAERVTGDATSPAAPPRTSALDEPSGSLPVGGSLAEKPSLPDTPSGHANAPASGPFASAAAQAPVNAEPADASTQITIDDFAKVELRVAQVVVAERIPKADKLLRLEVDLGYERRQILSGIAEWYAPEDLVGRRIVVITNLAPRKMRGLESHGMLLAASTSEGGKPVLATMAEEIALGSRLK